MWPSCLGIPDICGIYNPEYPLMGSCIIFHKHKVSHPYHQHGRSNTLRQAVRSIKSHDRWQMGGRKNID